MEDGEFFLDDYSVQRIVEIEDSRINTGRLKVCTRGLFFVPNDILQPIIRFAFRMMKEPLEMIKERDLEYITLKIRIVVAMKERGLDHPYAYHETSEATCEGARTAQWPTVYRFRLLHTAVPAFLENVNKFWSIGQHSHHILNRAEEAALLSPFLIRRLNQGFDFSLLVDFREKLLFTTAKHVDVVEPLLTYPSHLMLTNKRVYIQPAKINNVGDSVCTFTYTSIVQIHKRRHRLRQVGLEFIRNNANTCFLSFQSQVDRNSAYDMVMSQPELNHLITLPGLSEMLWRWKRREISNYDYLLHLNTISGRTKNDLTQYPVFPWVLTDYTSHELDLSNENIYRDLSKPIGALNDDRLAYFRLRHSLMPQGEEAEGLPPAFLYGTHYSTPGYVLYYLVRKHPQFMLCLQNGKFDTADRLFRSVQDCWKSCLTNYTDLKELIPEFYDVYSSPNDWLCNHQHLDFGLTQDLKRVDDVELPPWALSDPTRFIEINRAALESEYVSGNLHNWIDLIFGYKQQGEQALKSDNLFYYLSYQGAVDLENVEDPMERCSLESQIQEFGQTPRQLFAMPHPVRNAPQSSNDSIDETMPDTLLIVSPRTRQRSMQKLDSGCTYLSTKDGVESSQASEGLFLQERKHLARKHFLLFPLDYAADLITSLSFCGIKKPVTHGTKPYSRRWKWNRLCPMGSANPWCWQCSQVLDDIHSGEVTSCLLSRKEATLYSTSKDCTFKACSSLNGILKQEIDCGMALSCCALSPNERFVFLGCWDNCVYMFSVQSGRQIDKIVAHYDGVSAICVTKNYLVTSSWDAIVKIWRYTIESIVIIPARTFTEWDQAINCMDASPDGKFVVAGSRNGRIYLIDLYQLVCVREVTINPTRYGDIASLAFPDDTSFVCVTIENELIQVNLEGVSTYFVALPITGQVRCMKSDGVYVVCGTTSGRICFWKVGSSHISAPFYDIPHAHESTITSLTVSSSGSMIVSGGMDGMLLIWRLQQATSRNVNEPSFRK